MIVSVAARRSFPVAGFFQSSRSNSLRSCAIGFDAMLSATKIGSNGIDGENEPFPNLKVFEPKDLRHYYEETKRILLSPGGRNQNGDNATEDSESSISSLSLQSTNKTQAFSLQHFEPRHRKSMMRCVLNQFYADETKKGASEKKAETQSTPLLSKTDFQQRLRLLERKRRWRLTRSLLFGDKSFHRSADNDEMEQKHWWESDVIQDGLAPGLANAIREYRNSWENNDSLFTARNTVVAEKDDPKKFLSRLASGRTYKGNFRSLLEEYMDKSNKESNCDLLQIYDKITGGDASRKRPCDESNQRELELLNLFIDELEEAATAADNNNKANGCRESIDEPSTLMVTSEQILLLRCICNLDIFSSPPKLKFGSSSSGIPSVDDGGRSLGKKGERDLESYLVRKHEGGETRSSEDFSGTKVLSPVWVRPKDKNRRNTKEKCRFVLEIPRLQDAESNDNIRKKSKRKTNSYVSQGTTSEFDAMVVRVINSDANNESEGQIPPIMAIREVWDAKATLDPSALHDVLDKKARSLEKILCDENSNVVNLSNSSVAAGDVKGTTSSGANFVILPLRQSKKKDSSKDLPDASSKYLQSPKIYRVGIEPPRVMNDDGKNLVDYGRYESIPQIGVFASRMIGPGAAARRIQTIVYEGLLETDLSTVTGVLRQFQGNDGT